MEDKAFNITIGTIILFIVLLVIFVTYTEARKVTAPCEELGYITAKNLPARCLEFYKGGVTSI